MNIFLSKSKQKSDHQEGEMEKLKEQNSGLQRKVNELTSSLE